MNLSKKKLINPKQILFVVLLNLIALTSWAGKEKYNSRLNASSITSFPTVVSVVDPQYSVMQSTPGWPALFHNKSVKNRVIFAIDHASTNYIAANYSITLDADITYYSYVGSSFVPTTINKQLTITNYHGASGNWTDKAVLEIAGGHNVQVKINSITPVSGFTTDQLNFYIETELEIERFYHYNPNTAITQGQIFANNAYLATKGELEISWPPVEGAEEYDLEWVYVNDYDNIIGAYKPAGYINLDERLFQFNSTRISTSATFYTFPYVYGHGYILYRVRPVGYTSVDNYKSPIAGKWSMEITSPTTLSSISAGDYYAATISHEDHLNYQATITYAEEGKSKAVVGYFDGSLRNRQSVTKIKSDDNIIVGETYYDFQGRQAVSALPVPANSQKIDFVPYFNQYNNQPYDKSDFDISNGGNCGITAPPMDSTSGASKYYSFQSDFNQNEQAYVPTAKGYPFTVTEYAPDNTGKIRRQGGVGPQFQLGSTHETKYYYGVPEQEEIDRFFATEAGYANRYQKNMVLDANGQLSITYIDGSGKTVATGLTGNSPLTMSTLPSAQQSTLTVDVLNKNNPTDPYDLGQNNVIDQNAGTLKISKEILVAPAQIREFDYSLTMPKFDTSCVITFKDTNDVIVTRTDHICYECVADLTISLTDECNNEFLLGVKDDGTGRAITTTLDKIPGGQSILQNFRDSVPYDAHLSCTEPNITFQKGNLVTSTNSPWVTNDLSGATVQIPSGNYTLTKLVKINEEALQYYTKEYLDSNKNACLQKLSEFIAAEVAATDFSGCGITCQQCLEKLGGYDSLYNIVTNPTCDPCLTQSEYDDLVAECDDFCNEKSVKCENAYQAMIQDMSPMGQYGQVMAGGGTVGGVVQAPQPSTFNPSVFPLSVFNGNNLLPRKNAIQTEYYALLTSSSYTVTVPTWYKYSWSTNWRYPFNPQISTSDPARRFAYLDEDGNIVKIKVTPDGSGGYTPAIIPGTVPELINGAYYIEPKFLDLVFDFVSAFEPSWAGSLVAYHPEYADYEYCVLVSTSHDFDEKLLGLNTIAQVNTAFPGKTIVDFMTSGGIFTMDPFFNNTITGADVYGSQTAGYNASLLNQALTNYAINGSQTFSAWEIAFQIINCPNSQGSSICPPCTLGVNVFNNDQEWQLFRSTYLSLKQKLVDRNAIQYSNRHGGYNGCMNNDNFNPFQNGFYNTYTYSPASFYGYPFNWWWYGGWSINPFVSQYYNPEQPCNWARYWYYKDKDPRFPVNSQLIGLAATSSTPASCYDPTTGEEMLVCPEQNQAIADESANLAAISLYTQCGQCPNDMSFQMLLKGLATRKSNNIQTENDLTTATPASLSCYPPPGSVHPENTSILELAMWGVPATSTITWEYDNSVSTSTVLKGKFKQGTRDCELVLSFRDRDSIYSFEDIIDMCCLKATSSILDLANVPLVTNHNFTLIAKVAIKSGDYDFNTVPGQLKDLPIEGYISCLEIGTCALDPICQKSTEAQEMQNLWNGMLYSQDLSSSGGPLIVPVFTSTGITLSSQPYLAFLTDNLKDKIYAALSGGAVVDPAAVWSWDAISLDPKHVNGYIKVSTLGPKCEFTFAIDPTSIYSFADIKQLTNIKPDPSGVFGAFIATAIAQSGTSPAQNVTITGTCSCLSFGQCSTTMPESLTTGQSGNDNNSLGIYDADCQLTPTMQAIFKDLGKSIAVKGVQEQMAIKNPYDNSPCYAVFDIPVGLSFPATDLNNIVSVVPDMSYADVNGNTSHFFADFLLSPSNDTFRITGYITCGYVASCPNCTGVNLVVNGDFENGYDKNNPDFNSQYDNNIGSTVGSIVPGEMLVTQMSNVHIQGGTCADHTVTGNDMALIARSGYPQKNMLWSNSYVVLPNRDYVFEAWFSSNGDVNSIPIGVVFGGRSGLKVTTNETVPVGACIWTKYTYTVNSANEAVIQIQLDCFAANGSFIFVDDISFREDCEIPPPCNGLELVSNSNFEQGYNTTTPDFASTYIYTSSTQPFTFVSGNFNVMNCATVELCQDHTPSNTNNFALIAKNGYSKYLHVWRKTFTVSSNTNYDFEAWFNSFDGKNLPFEIRFDGNNSSTPTIKNYSTPQNGLMCYWDKFAHQWNSGTNTSVTISITCVSTEGKLFGIDDISFKAPCPPVTSSIMCNVPSMPPIEVDPNPCATQLMNIAFENAESKYEDYINDLRAKFRENYIRQCLKVQENFLMKYIDAEHHFTLYYYDQAGNLVRTIPPQGVVKITDLDPANGRTQSVVDAEMLQIKQDRFNHTRTVFTKHTYPTTYKYNSLNQLTAQTMPDHQNMNLFSVSGSNTGIPSGYTVNNISFTSSSNGSAYTTDNSGQGHIFVTTNGGNTWSEINALGLGKLNDVVFDNSNPAIAYVVGDNGVVLKTTNSGTNWDIVTPPSTDHIFRIFIDAPGTNLYAYTRNGNIFISTDGAVIWNPVSSTLASFLTGDVINDISFEGNNALAVTQSGKIFITSTNPFGWAQSLSLSSVDQNGVSYSSSQLYSVGKDGTLLTSGTGDNWTEVFNNLTVDLKEVYFVNINEGYALDINGNLLKSADQGLTWAPTPAIALTGVKDIYFNSPAEGYVIKNDGQVYRYSGGTWNTFGGASSVNALCSYVYGAFGTNDVGFIGGSSATMMIKPTGSTSWSTITTSGLLATDAITELYISNYSLVGTVATGSGWAIVSNKLYNFTLTNTSGYAVSFVQQTSVTGTIVDMFYDPSGIPTIYAVNSNGTLFSSITGGLTWTSEVVSSFGPVSVNSMEKDPSGNIVVVGNGGEIWKRDSFGTWTTKKQNIKVTQLNGAEINGVNYYAVSEDGTLLTSSNNGTSWKTEITASNINLNAISANNSTDVTAVGDGGNWLYKSGSNWTLGTAIAGYTLDLKDVVYNSGTAYAAGEDCSILSISGATGSVAQAASGSDDLLAIASSSSNKMLAVGEAGKIFYFNGASWNAQNVMVPPVINDASFNGNNGYAVGENGSILSTANGGSTWTNEVSGTTLDLNAVYTFNVPNKAIAVGNNGVVLVKNGGAWSPLGSITGVDLKDVHFDAAETFGLVVGTGGALYALDNSLASITPVMGASCSGSIYNAVHVVNNKLAFIAGNNGLLIRIEKPAATFVFTCLKESITSNNWPLFLTGTTQNLNDIYFTDNVTGYAVGNNNLILKTTNGGDSWTLINSTSSAGSNLVTIASTGSSTYYVGGTSSAIASINDMTDDWSSFFYYDKLGRLVVSQNSKQFAKSPYTYSYTLYDFLGRITEVGEVAASASIKNQYVNNQLDDNLFSTWLNAGTRTEITRTVYDVVSSAIPGFVQENLRTRVSSSNFRKTNTLGYDRSTHYSYDIHGNVKTLIQEEVALASLNQQYKRVDYSYDLISGKVNTVVFQQGKADQFMHKYEYDADNRITNVLTSSDGVIWDQDAKYFYYKHGPLARAEIGDLKVQGMDYAYTLQGWIKGVNSNILKADNDIGKDGKPLTTAHTDLHEYMPTDEFGYSLTYFKGDYTPINTAAGSNYFLADASSSGIEATRKDLFNGNISAMVTSINKFKDPGFHGGYSEMKTFGYDQLNRLVNVVFDDKLETNTGAGDYNSFKSGAPGTDYAESFTYDANGNIQNATRNAYVEGVNNQMDNMTYKYETVANGFGKNTNKLKAVFDTGDNASTTAATWSDIKGGQVFDVSGNHAGDNYQYDEIGNLKRDAQEKIANIEWTVYGKIAKVQRIAGSGKDDLEFEYDAAGNRISKKVIKPSGDIVTTYYVRDASGNTMATYEHEVPLVNNPSAFVLKEHDMYGSSRLGVKNRNIDLMATIVANDVYTRTLGSKSYEESNHLGNVLSVISDSRIPIPDGTNTQITAFKSDVISASDYYSFGSLMQGRSYTSTNRYRYGFNGKELDHESETQDYGMRIYHPNLGRFLSVDPLWGDYPQLTTYQFASNRPIDGTDLDGLEYVTVHIRLNKDGTRTEICRDNHYLEMSRAQIQEVHGDPDKFYKKYSAAFEKEGRGVKYVYYNNVDGQDVLSKKKPTWESRQHAAAPWNPEAKFRRHGIWAGSGGITILGAEGKLPNMDKSFGYIDQIDKLAKAHDEFYDYAGYEDKDWRRNFSDNAIAADQALVDGFKDYAKKVDDSRDKEGNITYVDPVTGRAASEEAYETAKKAGDYFEKIIKEKQDKKANKASTKHNKK